MKMISHDTLRQQQRRSSTSFQPQIYSNLKLNRAHLNIVDGIVKAFPSPVFGTRVVKEECVHRDRDNDLKRHMVLVTTTKAVWPDGPIIFEYLVICNTEK